jgi:methionine synthase II (cobalamin-independent)
MSELIPRIAGCFEARRLPILSGIAKHECKAMYRASKDQMKKEYESQKKRPEGEEFFQDCAELYRDMALTLKPHWIKVHEIENKRILAGKPKREVLEASSKYLQSVIDGKVTT